MLHVSKEKVTNFEMKIFWELNVPKSRPGLLQYLPVVWQPAQTFFCVAEASGDPAAGAVAVGGERRPPRGQIPDSNPMPIFGRS